MDQINDQRLPDDWLEQLVRAYTVFGAEPGEPPLTGGAFDWMSKAMRSRLSAIQAKTRKRIKGRFAEEGKRYGSSGGSDVREVRADTDLPSSSAPKFNSPSSDLLKPSPAVLLRNGKVDIDAAVDLYGNGSPLSLAEKVFRRRYGLGDDVSLELWDVPWGDSAPRAIQEEWNTTQNKMIQALRKSGKNKTRNNRRTLKAGGFSDDEINRFHQGEQEKARAAAAEAAEKAAKEAAEAAAAAERQARSERAAQMIRDETPSYDSVLRAMKRREELLREDGKGTPEWEALVEKYQFNSNGYPAITTETVYNEQFRNMLTGGERPRFHPVPPTPESVPRGSSLEALGYDPSDFLNKQKNPASSELEGLVGRTPEQTVEIITKALGKAYSSYIGNMRRQQPNAEILSPEEFVKAGADVVRRRLLQHDTAQKTRIGADFFASVIEDGAIKSQLELVGTGERDQYRQGYVDGRDSYESAAMGVPLGQPFHLRPVYGFVGDPELMERYGVVEFQFNEDVVDRTTLTPLDSLNSKALGVISQRELRDGTVSDTQLIASLGEKLIEQLGDGVVADDFTGIRPTVSDPTEYVEGQIHGGVTLNDVATIVFDSPAKVLQEQGRGSGAGPFESLDEMFGLNYGVERQQLSDDRLFSIMGSEVQRFIGPQQDLTKQQQQLINDFKQDIVRLYKSGKINSLADAESFPVFLQNYLASIGYPNIAVKVTR